MPDTDYSTFIKFFYIDIFNPGLVITTVFVGLLLWEAKQRKSRAMEEEAQNIAKEAKQRKAKAMEEEAQNVAKEAKQRKAKAMEEEAQNIAKDAKKRLQAFCTELKGRALWKDGRMTQIDGVTGDGLDTAQNLGGDEWQSTEGSSEESRRSRKKASKKKKKPRSQQYGLPEDFRSFVSSLDGLAFTPSGTPCDAFKTAHEPPAKGKGILPNRSKLDAVHDPLFGGGKHAFLSPGKQRNTQGEDIGGPEPIKAFRTTEDGVLHVDNNVNNNGFNEINVFDSRNRGTLDEKLGSPTCEDPGDGIRTTKISLAKLKEEFESIKLSMDAQKSQPSSSSIPEPPSQEVEAILAGIQSPKLAPTEISSILVLQSCQSSREAQKYIDHACKDDSDVTKTLKKQCITAFLEYRKKLEILDPGEDEIIQSLNNTVADLVVKACSPSANIENETTPVTTAVEASNPRPARPSQCMFFSKLPPEIRMMVYRRILTTKTRLNPGAEIEKTSCTLTTDDNDPSRISGIDSAVMRTCRKMYHETLPVLYSENKFVCRTPEQLKAFQEGNLDTTLGETMIKQRPIVI